MLLKYFYDRKLAHASYLVGCQATGEAIVIDPGRDVDQYLDTARGEGMRIVATTETHIHADFVSGCRELAARVGARLYLSDEGDEPWKYYFAGEYNHQLLKDGDTFPLGNLRFEVLHTPGHTPEHISLLLYDHPTAPIGLFSGDFVFVGDVGRPDLLEKAAGVTGSAEQGARQMFQSLRRFKSLPDYLQVWPAHGAGSACGKALGAIPSSTVGYEKRFNWALKIEDQEVFIEELLSGQPETPTYFREMKRINRDGPPLLYGAPLPPMVSSEQLEEKLGRGTVIVDTRPAVRFSRAHIPGTINIPYDDSFTTWAGWLLPYDEPFYLIAGHAQQQEIMRDLRYIGLDNAGGFFDVTAIEAWKAEGNPLQSYGVAEPEEVASRLEREEILLLDVRSRAEWEEGHIPGAVHIMLGHLPGKLDSLPSARSIVIHCQSGARSAIAASLLQARGMRDVMNMKGGLGEWERRELPVERCH